MNRTQGYGKNTVRINESQLRDMIAESVRNVLNEMDWKTAENARVKARREVVDIPMAKHTKGEKVTDNDIKKIQRRLRQAKSFADYRNNAFNDEYAMCGEDEYGYPYEFRMEGDDAPLVGTTRRLNGNIEYHRYNPDARFGSPKGKIRSMYPGTEDIVYDGPEMFGDETTPGYMGRVAGEKKQTKADKGMEDYYHHMNHNYPDGSGDYEYDNGWKLK